MTPEALSVFDRYMIENKDEHSFQRNLLALDALSKLARQFSNQPQLAHLSDMLLLTMAGQFSVSSAFLKLIHPGLADSDHAYLGIGKFKENSSLKEANIENRVRDYFAAHTSPVLVTELSDLDDCRELAMRLYEAGTVVVVPLVHSDTIIGILGLGDKVTGKTFSDADLELLSTLAHSLTPFVSNSLMFRQISELNHWYSDILNSVEQSVFIFDGKGFLKLANSSALGLLKKMCDNREAFLIKRPPMADIFDGRAFPGWLQRISRSGIYSSSKMLDNMTAYIADSEYIFNVRVGQLRQEASGDYDTFVTLDDITAEKASEQRLFEVEKFAEKGVIVSSIAHELNNFLGLILGAAEIATMSLAKGKIDKVEATIEKIKANVGRMERFTAGLVDYTRMNTRKAEANLNNIISDVLAFVAVQKKYKRITILTDLDTELPRFVVDSDQMSQLLMNLVNNAADAIIEANREERKIVVATSFENNMAVLKVSDNGVGIPPEVKERLFRAHLTTKEKGHGYGLVTCSKIIDNHRGKVEIETVLGEGTTFILRFPIDQGEKRE